MENINKKLFEAIKNINEGKTIKIRTRKLTSGLHNLYLDLTHNNRRSFKSLRKYLKGTTDSRQEDNEILRYAIRYRDSLELELMQKNAGFKLNEDISKLDFFTYFDKLKERKSTNTRKKWTATKKHLEIFTKGKLMISEIDQRFCTNFYYFLKDNCSHSTPITYYKVFSAALNSLVMDEIININPAKLAMQREDLKREISKSKSKRREFLTIEEVKKLENTPMDDKNIKYAFLFSCYSGLRLCDIRKLTHDMIQDGAVYFRQNKTSEDERNKLLPQALEILEKQNKNTRKKKLIFKLPDNKVINRHIAKWIKRAEINKKITFHCARHSFATIILNKGIDIYLVKELMGHKDLKSTQVYARLINKRKDEAIDKLGKLL